MQILEYLYSENVCQIFIIIDFWQFVATICACEHLYPNGTQIVKHHDRGRSSQQTAHNQHEAMHDGHEKVCVYLLSSVRRITVLCHFHKMA